MSTAGGRHTQRCLRLNEKTMNESTNLSNQQTQNSTPAQLMTKDEVAVMLRKSRRTIEHWVNSGYISAIRINRSVLFDREQVLKDIKHFETQSAGTMFGQ